MEVTCPHCNYGFTVPGDLRNNASIVCPQCGKAFECSKHTQPEDFTDRLHK